MGMRMIGIKFFRMINIGRLFLEGEEVTASAAELNAAAGTATAANISIADAGNRFTAEQVEAALQEIAGSGRTNQTVKGVADVAGAAYVKPGTGIPSTDMATAVQTSLGKADSALQPGVPINIVAGTPVNAVGSTQTLTFAGVAKDGETVTIGADVYEFASDVLQTLAAPGNIAVDIIAQTTKSTNNLTIDTQPISGDTMTIGGKLYTFVPVGTDTADGEVSIGGNLAGAKLAIVAAINGTDGHNVANAFVSAGTFGGDVSAITALRGGVAGDAIATIETFFAGTNIFSAGTLGGGADCSAANAVTRLVAEITAHDTAGFSAADGANDTVVITAKVKGVAKNGTVLNKTTAQGTWGGGSVTASGVDGTVGVQWATLIDASYLYVAIAANTIADANWRRVTLGSAY